MKNIILLAGFIIFLFLRACAPSESMYAGKIGEKNEMPRFCFQPRLLFYEVLSNDNWVRLWLHTNNSTTKSQLLKNPLRIYMAQKNKRHIRYILEYKNVFDAKEADRPDTTTNQRQLQLFRIVGKDTTDVTSDYNFKISADLDDQQYDLKVDWPKKLIVELEEPVIGIESFLSLNPDNSNRVNLRTAPDDKNQAFNTNSRATNRDYSTRQFTESNYVGYQTIDLDIDIWFRLYLSRPGHTP